MIKENMLTAWPKKSEGYLMLNVKLSVATTLGITIAQATLNSRQTLKSQLKALPSKQFPKQFSYNLQQCNCK